MSRSGLQRSNIFADMSRDAEYKIERMLMLNEEKGAYGLSMSLMQAAYLKNVVVYEKIKEKVVVALGVKEEAYALNDPLSAWLIGRLMLSEALMDHRDNALHLSVVLFEYLSQLNPETLSNDDLAKVTWAAGYLTQCVVILDKSNYESVCSILTSCLKLLEAREDVSLSDSNMLWANVVAISAIAQAADQASFLYLSVQIAGKHETILQGLMQIPETDFRLWAFAIVSEAAKNVGAEELYQGLSDHITKLLPTAERDGNDYLLCELLMTQVMQKIIDEEPVCSSSEFKQ